MSILVESHDAGPRTHPTGYCISEFALGFRDKDIYPLRIPKGGMLRIFNSGGMPNLTEISHRHRLKMMSFSDRDPHIFPMFWHSCSSRNPSYLLYSRSGHILRLGDPCRFFCDDVQCGWQFIQRLITEGTTWSVETSKIQITWQIFNKNINNRCELSFICRNKCRVSLRP